MKKLKVYIFILCFTSIENSYGDITENKNFNSLQSFTDCTPDTITIYDTICEVDFPYIYNDRVIVTEGIFTDTLTNYLGCDSIVTLNLSSSTKEIPVFNMFPSDVVTGFCEIDINLPTMSDNGVEGRWFEGNSGYIITENFFPEENYYFTFVPFNKCSDSLTIEVFIVPKIQITSEITNVTKEGLSDGKITIDITSLNDTTGLSYSWSNGERTKDISGLSEGIYSLIIWDSHGCDFYEEFEISVDCIPDTITIYDTICEDEFPYEWNENVILKEGIFTDTLTNYLGCDSIITLYLSTTTKEVPVFNWLPSVFCEYDYIDLPTTSDNGIEGLWFGDFGSTKEFFPYPAGVYSFTFIPFEKCIDSITIYLEIYYTIEITSNVKNESKKGLKDGSISIDIKNPVDPLGLSFSWSNGESTKDISGLSEGVYSLHITGSYVCDFYEKFEITVQNVTSSNEFLNNRIVNFLVYPNPSNGIVSLIIDSSKNMEFDLEVISSTGQIQLSNKLELSNSINRSELNLSSFPKGNYFVKLKFNEDIIVKKIVIQ
jgi:hypothetical protein